MQLDSLASSFLIAQHLKRQQKFSSLMSKIRIDQEKFWQVTKVITVRLYNLNQ